MLPKKFRLTTRNFSRVYHKSSKFKRGDFLFLVGNEKIIPHFGVVVGKKVSKLAVIRNRLRRQLYEQIRLFLLPKITDKSVICLYNGKEILQNTNAFHEAIKDLLQFLKK